MVKYSRELFLVLSNNVKGFTSVGQRPSTRKRGVIYVLIFFGASTPVSLAKPTSIRFVFHDRVSTPYLCSFILHLFYFENLPFSAIIADVLTLVNAWDVK